LNEQLLLALSIVLEGSFEVQQQVVEFSPPEDDVPRAYLRDFVEGSRRDALISASSEVSFPVSPVLRAFLVCFEL
jgi:hypothetical protein